jgi:hypothetical protein
LPPAPAGNFSFNGPLLRFVGAARWSMADSTKLDAFYRLKFGKPLPVNAFGRTETHQRPVRSSRSPRRRRPSRFTRRPGSSSTCRARNLLHRHPCRHHRFGYRGSYSHWAPSRRSIITK